MNIKGRSK